MKQNSKKYELEKAISCWKRIKRRELVLICGEKLVKSKAFKFIIKGAFWVTIAIALLMFFMIGSFLFKIYFLDYRFDDGELHPPIESSINNDQFNSYL